MSPGVRVAGCQRGVGLVEWMIALVIGLILLSGVVQIFVANQSAYRESRQLARMQNTVAHTMDLLVRDLRGATAVDTGTPGRLGVTRNRTADWCGQPPGESEIFYWVADETLRCGPDPDAGGQALVEGLAPGSTLQATPVRHPVDHDLLGLDLALDLRLGGDETRRFHFRVALRQAILQRL
ncbi:prepilin-type N-terminal cleavage/methylation domain-containing protein [Ectothiorhodospira mobilis]|uniref:prepilin-type N-terminal cleavage/methylation domain-containing protein n=1 Tax=Ectothiorhodospira mobilis TaxID=195064 RepID=UPI001907FBCE